MLTRLGLTALVSALFSPLLLVDSTNSRQIHSCTTSLLSYIQQRSRLFSVHDTRKYTQSFIFCRLLAYKKPMPLTCVWISKKSTAAARWSHKAGWLLLHTKII